MFLFAFYILFIVAGQRTQGQTCAGKWTWIQPSGDSQTLSAGAGVTFEVSVEDGVLEENDIVVWKIGDAVTLTTDTYDGSQFTSVTGVDGVTSSFEAQTDVGNKYTVNIPENTLTVADHNGQLLTVRSGACDDADEGDKVSPGVALTIKYCDGTFADSTYSGPNDCGYNCEGTFNCDSAAGLTFTAICQADASWSTTTTPPADQRCQSCDINAFSAVSINPGSPQNAALCGAGCKKTFTCNNYPSVTFEATCQNGDAWSATVPSQDDRCSLTCKDTWVWNQPDGVNTLTLSVGAPFQFQASVEDDLVVNDIVEWKIGSGLILITDTYNAENTFDSVIGVTGVTTTFEAQGDGFGNKYTVNIPENFLTESDHNGQSVTVRSETCDDADGKVSPGVTLTVKYCDTNSFADGTYSGSACGYNCVAQFACNANDATGLTFQATCQADATWSASTPPVDQRCKSCDLNEFSGQSVTNPGSPENSDLCGVDCVKTFKCTAGGSVTFQATCQQDLTWGATTPVESERCTRCDLTSFSGSSVTNPGTAENNDACIVGCERTFKCTDDESLTFKATCQQDLTWGETTPTEAERCQKSSSISCTRGSVLIWLILASIACITFEVEL